MENQTILTQDANTLNYITTPEALRELFEQLMQVKHVAVDTESNSLYAYRERVCLLQISIPGKDYIVDPLAVDDLSSLSAFFAAQHIEKVFHAADYDLMVLRRDFDFECTPLFDTMWAARILGWAHVGLGSILEKHFDVHPDKRYQRYNWGKRPLEAEAIHYAWMDTHHLLELREMQVEALHRMGRWEEAQEIFEYIQNSLPEFHHSTPDEIFWRIKGIHTLTYRGQKVLYRLHLWREETAEKLERPPMKVVNDARLIRLAQIQPRTKTDLINAGLTPYQSRRFGPGILKALHSDSRPLPPMPPNNNRPPAMVIERYDSLKSWRKDVAAQRGVDPDVILPNAVLWDIAQRPPQTLSDLLDVSGIGPWRQEHYGPSILQLVGK
ncbi:MAG: ribonuclease D [Anaerolineae bacterium]|nr:ribonuclease D [Anaerolineae bacterium]